MLRPAGFRWRGAPFVREVADVTHVASLHSSRTTSHQVVLTVNLGVIAPEALQSWDSPTSVMSAQWRARAWPSSKSTRPPHPKDPCVRAVVGRRLTAACSRRRLAR